MDIGIDKGAFKFFGLEIYWYAVIIVTAILLGFIYAMIRSKHFGMISDLVFDAAFCGFIGGALGARLYYVILHNLNPDTTFKYSFITFFTKIRSGGLAIYGGVIGAVIFALIYMKLRKIKMRPILDLAGLGFLLGIGIGRWGNFTNQEAYGAVTESGFPLGMTGDIIAEEVGAGALVHPTFLYESLWCLLGFALLHFYSKKLRSFDGEIFLLFVTWYGAGRIFTEELRAESHALMLGSIKVSQVIAVISAVLALGAFIYFKRKGKDLYSETEESAAAIAEYEKVLILAKEKASAKKALRKEATAPSIIEDDDSKEDAENGEDS